MNSFHEMELAPNILRGVDAAGFEKPTPIQERSLGPLLSGHDVIGQAKTGTGKTAAYGLTLLQSIDLGQRAIQALVLAPTRELAVQITAEIRKLGKFTGTKLLTVYGGQSINVQLDALRQGVHTVVGTPGRLIDHIKRGSIDLSSVKFLVLDEADTMLDMGFVEDVEYIIESIHGEKQVSLFSATMPPRIIELSERYMHKPEKILLDSDELSVEKLNQSFLVVEPALKFSILLDLLKEEKPFSTMIFCRTRYGVRRLARDLGRARFKVVQLHGDLSQHQRDQAMYQFRKERAEILVATDVASRGIDIRSVDCVVNYEVPENPLLYFHRVGRTARAGDAGKSFTFVTRQEFGDFGRIIHLTKAVIKPKRKEDEGHTFPYSQGGDDGRSRYRRFGQRRFAPRKFGARNSSSQRSGKPKYGARQFPVADTSGRNRFRDRGQPKFGRRRRDH